MKWYALKEKKPKPKKNSLTSLVLTWDGKEIKILQYLASVTHIDCFSHLQFFDPCNQKWESNIIYWMELPTPPFEK